ncbi:MAG: hypothetical protein ACRDRV_12095 [Pseudonocardiaceae bacterium]
MSHEVKRVPLDFGWPLNKVWEGYLMPDSLKERPCPAGEACEHGQTSARAWVEEIAQLALMLDDDMCARGNDLYPLFCSVPGGGTHGPRPRPSADIHEFVTGLAGRADMFGHDVSDRLRATKRLIEAAGLDPEKWGVCPTCEGHGSVEAYPHQRAEAEAWEGTGPPSGEGWQLWEIAPEGSPASPVFATAEELAHWLTTPEGGAAAGPSRQPMTIEQACEFVGVGRTPSGFMTAGGVRDGASHIRPETRVGGLFDHNETDGPLWQNAGSVDAAEQSSTTAGGSAATVEGPPPVTELIFEAVSAWFQEQRGAPAHPVSGHKIDETATLPTGFPNPVVPPRSAATALDWRSAADDGWRAANALRASTDYEVTSAGLPRRQPQAHLVPGAAGSSQVEFPPSSDGLIRSPTEVRIRLSNYQRGLHRGRHTRSGTDD